MSTRTMQISRIQHLSDGHTIKAIIDNPNSVVISHNFLPNLYDDFKAPTIMFNSSIALLLVFLNLHNDFMDYLYEKIKDEPYNTVAQVKKDDFISFFFRPNLFSVSDIFPDFVFDRLREFQSLHFRPELMKDIISYQYGFSKHTYALNFKQAERDLIYSYQLFDKYILELFELFQNDEDHIYFNYLFFLCFTSIFTHQTPSPYLEKILFQLIRAQPTQKELFFSLAAGWEKTNTYPEHHPVETPTKEFANDFINHCFKYIFKDPWFQSFAFSSNNIALLKYCDITKAIKTNPECFSI